MCTSRSSSGWRTASVRRHSTSAFSARTFWQASSVVTVLPRSLRLLPHVSSRYHGTRRATENAQTGKKPGNRTKRVVDQILCSSEPP